MSSQDRLENVLRDIHVMISKSEVYDTDRIIVSKQDMFNLIDRLNASIYEIMDMLDGYCLREMEREPDCVQNNGFWDGFCRYVEDYYHVTTSQGWCRIIEFYSTSRADAFDKFFRRYDEYLAAYRAGETPPPRF